MSLNHPDHRTYAEQLGPALNRFIEAQRDQKFEGVLWEAIMFFSFTLEDVEQKAKKDVPILQKLGIILIALSDVCRGILAAHVNLCPMALATGARVAVELRAKLNFILSRADPALYADRYWRHQMIERLHHDQRTGALKIPPQERDAIVAACPEWIKGKKPDGNYKLSLNWTAEKAFESVASIAEAAGMKNDYNVMYDVTSKYIHGSPLMAHGYRGKEGIGPLGEPKRCKQMASLATLTCMRGLRTACEFFQLPWEDAYRPWQERFLQVAEDLTSG